MTKVLTYRRLVIKIGWSSAWWSTKTDKGVKHSHLASVHLAENDRHTVVCCVLWPLFLAAGIAV